MEDDFLEKTPDDFKGIISPAKADKVIQQINEKREKNHDYWVSEHIRRLDKVQIKTDIVKAVYKEEGVNLEIVVCDLLETKFMDCMTQRITQQKEPEPDLLIRFNEGETFAVQVTAKKDNKQFIDSLKTGEVLAQSADHQPNGYICLGRPDFQGLAIKKSIMQGELHNLKLLPMYSFVELYVRVKENLITPDQVANYIKESKGYLNIASINKYFLS